MTRNIKQAHNHDPAQGAMFRPEKAVARRDALPTSKVAAASVKGIKEAHEKIFWLIKHHGPMTDYELRDRARESGFHFSWSGLSARRGEMCPPRGYGLRDSGITRPTPNKRPATVWEIDPSHELEVPPARVRNLRQTQRDVLSIFEEAKKQGIDRMSHAQLCYAYDGEAALRGWELVQSASSVRTRCSELVELKLVKQYPDSETEKGNIAMWGLA